MTKATDERTRRRKSVVDEIDELKSKRRQLECDLTELQNSASARTEYIMCQQRGTSHLWRRAMPYATQRMAKRRT